MRTRWGTGVGIVGAGSVGTAIAFAVAATGVADAVALYDIDGARAAAEAMDLRHAAAFLPPIAVSGGDDPALLAQCDVIVFAAGVRQAPGQTRLELADANAALCRSSLPPFLAQTPESLVLVVTNPVDVITLVAQELHPAGSGRVFGSGTVLDTARLRVLLAGRLGLAPTAVHASIVGEHGDSEFALWSSAVVGGAPLRAWLERTGCSDRVLSELLDEVRNAAYEIIAGKGATSTAIGMASARIIRAVRSDERAILPVSTRHDVEGIGSVCLSLPTIVGADGPEGIAPVVLSEAESEAWRASAAAVRSVVESMDR